MVKRSQRWFWAVIKAYLANIKNGSAGECLTQTSRKTNSFPVGGSALWQSCGMPAQQWVRWSCGAFCRTQKKSKGRSSCPALEHEWKHCGQTMPLTVALHKAWFTRGISGICLNKLKIHVTDVLWPTEGPDIKPQEEQRPVKKGETWYWDSKSVLLMVTVRHCKSEMLFYLFSCWGKKDNPQATNNLNVYIYNRERHQPLWVHGATQPCIPHSFKFQFVFLNAHQMYSWMHPDKKAPVAET